MASKLLNIALAAPAIAKATATTGGSIPSSTTYYYTATAYNEHGETAKQTEVSQATGAGTETNTITITLTAVPGAVGYRIFGRSTGAEKLLIDMGPNLVFVDTGTAAYPEDANVAAPTSATTTAGNCFAAFAATANGRQVTKGNANVTPTTPFIAGRNATIVNLTGSTITVSGSDDDVTYTTLVAAGTNTYTDVTIPNYVKASATGAYMLAGA